VLLISDDRNGVLKKEFKAIVVEGGALFWIWRRAEFLELCCV
jgi:hypothetical protein